MTALMRPRLAVVSSSRRRTSVPPVPTTGMVTRLKADTGVTSSSGRLTAWTDQASSPQTITLDANAPWLAADYLGRPVVRFDGQTVNLPSGLTIAPARSFTARNLAVFLIGRFRGTTSSLVFGAGATAGNIRILATSSVFGYSAQAQASSLRVRNNPALAGVIATTGGQKVVTNIEDSSSLSAPTATTGNGLIVGHTATPSSYAYMDVYEILVYEGWALTDSKIADLKAYAAAQYSLRTSAYTKNAVFVGDSITAGINGAGSPAGTQFFLTSYPDQILRSATEDWKLSNLGVSGATIGSLPTAGADGYYDAAATKNILIGQIGRNDVTAADNSATIYSAIVSYVQARVTAGFTVWWGTMIATSATVQPTADALNAKLRGTPLGGTGNGLIADAGASKILDFGALSQFDATGDTSNTTYYQADNTHPTQAGAGLMADLVATQLIAA